MEANGKKKSRLLLQGAVVLGTIAAAVLSAACSSESEDQKSEEKKEQAGDISIAPVANAAEAENPVDATPSPDGNDIYFIASTRKADPEGLGFERVPAIFKVSAKGGPLTKLFEGAPLGSPFNITISDDGQTLFLADSAADTTEDRSDGKVWTMSAGGGAPTALAGTDGLAPGGVEVMGDTLYITGHKDGQAGVFRTGLGGGNVTALKTGAPFTDPSGVAVAKSGEVYVVDSGSVMSAEGGASVIKVTADGNASVLVSGIAIGHPGGIALAADDKTLFISGLDSGKGTDTVYAVKLDGLQISEAFTSTIGEFYDSAGLHRARTTNVFAWADSRAGKTGTVYVLGK
jgi:sugar lactone lactonase YvrE